MVWSVVKTSEPSRKWCTELPKGRGKGVSQQKRRRESNHFLPYFTSIPWHPEGARLYQSCVTAKQTWTSLWLGLNKLSWSSHACLRFFGLSAPSPPPHCPPLSGPPVFSPCSAMAPLSALKRVVVENWKSLLHLDEGERKTPGGGRGWGGDNLFLQCQFLSPLRTK